jgi:hypothetical protein
MALPSAPILLLTLNAVASALILLYQALRDRTARQRALQAKSRQGASGNCTNGSGGSGGASKGWLSSLLCCCRKRAASGRSSVAPPRPLPTVSVAGAHGTALSAAMSALSAAPAARQWLWAAAFCALFGCPAYLAEQRYAEKKGTGKKGL